MNGGACQIAPCAIPPRSPPPMRSWDAKSDRQENAPLNQGGKTAVGGSYGSAESAVHHRVVEGLASADAVSLSTCSPGTGPDRAIRPTKPTTRPAVLHAATTTTAATRRFLSSRQRLDARNSTEASNSGFFDRPITPSHLDPAADRQRSNAMRDSVHARQTGKTGDS